MHRSSSAMLAAIVCVGFALAGPAASTAIAQPMAKAQVANLITKVENGVDEFRDYLEKRGENASDAKSSAQASGRRKGATDSQKAKANTKKDALDDALGDLNKSTNRLRRKFDATDKWMETKSQVESVVDDARKINQVVARGNYGADAARLWAALRTGINDLAARMACSPWRFSYTENANRLRLDQRSQLEIASSERLEKRKKIRSLLWREREMEPALVEVDDFVERRGGAIVEVRRPRRERA